MGSPVCLPRRALLRRKPAIFRSNFPALRDQVKRRGPVQGVIASKVLALGIGALCIYLNKSHGISYWYGGLVIWNLLVMLSASGHMGL
jgi:hypothetical protein